MRHSTERHRITTPELHQAAAIIRLRKEVFQEELTRSGVSSDAVKRHTANWDSPSSAEKYQETMTRWLENETRHYRTVMLGRATVGLFIADRGSTVDNPNYIRVIQLAPDIRGQGVGRELIDEFQTKANPELPTVLDVLAGNTPAVGFYHHLGFRPVGEDSMNIADEVVPTIRMQKGISS